MIAIGLLGAVGIGLELRRRRRIPCGCRSPGPPPDLVPKARGTAIAVEHKLSVVLPIKIRSHQNRSKLERIQRLLLPSFVKFFACEDLHTFFVIAPPEDLEAVRQGISPLADALRIEVLCDDDVSPRVAGMTRGWAKQQILKLAVADRVGTPVYLAIDSDNLLVRPTSFADLIPNGRPRLTFEAFSTHPKWYRASGRLLRYPIAFERDERVMSVTPQLLHTHVSRGLQHEIEKQRGATPWECLLARRRGWTEYSLYWLYLCRHHDPEVLYDFSEPGLFRDCVWGENELDAAFVSRIFKQSAEPFTVLQSRFLDVAEVHRLVGPRLEI